MSTKRTILKLIYKQIYTKKPQKVSVKLFQKAEDFSAEDFFNQFLIYQTSNGHKMKVTIAVALFLLPVRPAM